jgi:hypothetical protein
MLRAEISADISSGVRLFSAEAPVKDVKNTMADTAAAANADNFKIHPSIRTVCTFYSRGGVFYTKKAAH